jgi:putative phage-type endonuclease
MIKEEYIQGTEAWKELRYTKITASDASVILGVNPWMTRDNLLKQKLRLFPETIINSSMQRGIDLEPIARKRFEQMTGILVVPDVKIHPINDWMMVSLDGISIDEKDIVEIKCTNKKNHELAKNGIIPGIYYPQVQHQISVCGVDSCHYFSFDGHDGIIVLVERDDNFINEMIEKEYEFYKEMCELREKGISEIF